MRIDNTVFQEWCDALIACQHDRSLKTTLTPIVSKLSDMRVVNGELETMDYDVLIGGEYKLLLEPFAFYKFEGNMFATTATEAALYDEQTSGLLRRRMYANIHYRVLMKHLFIKMFRCGYILNR